MVSENRKVVGLVQATDDCNQKKGKLQQYVSIDKTGKMEEQNAQLGTKQEEEEKFITDERVEKR